MISAYTLILGLNSDSRNWSGQVLLLPSAFHTLNPIFRHPGESDLLRKMLKQIFPLEHTNNPTPIFEGQDFLDPIICWKTPIRYVLLLLLPYRTVLFTYSCLKDHAGWLKACVESGTFMVQTSFQHSPTQEMMKLAQMRAYVNMCYPLARQTDEGLLFLEAPDDGHDPVMWLLWAETYICKPILALQIHWI